MTVRIFLANKDFNLKEFEVEDDEVAEAITMEDAVDFAKNTVDDEGEFGILVWPEDKPLPAFIKSRLLVSPVASSDPGR